LGESWGRTARDGWVIGVSGDLGVGKTQLVRGIAKGLGIDGRIQSPTFALINFHASGRLELHHIDLYRLDTREQVLGAGLEDYLVRPDGVTVVEWVERWWGEKGVPSGSGWCRRVWMKQESETKRLIQYEDFGG